MASVDKEVATELPGVIKVYKDGTVERILASPHVPPSPEDPATGVSSKDITISPHVSARLHLPKLAAASAQKLPVLVSYFGGGFCIGSAFSLFQHRYMNAIASEAKALIVSVEYRLAPENPLPAAYEDSWVALQWVASHSSTNLTNAAAEREQWLTEHGDFNRIFIGGDSAGANITHNIAMRAGSEELTGGVKISGAILSHPYFWGSEPIGSELGMSSFERSFLARFWAFAYPSASGGIDSPMVNPFAGDAPGLAGLGCSRLLVCVAGKDPLRERGVRYYAAVKESGWRGEIEELFEVEDEDHWFHVSNCDTENAKRMVKRVASFISQ